jgi:hypothetical protein
VAERPMGNRLPTGPGSRGGRIHDPEYRRAYWRAWKAAHPEYRERERLRRARERARERGEDPSLVTAPAGFPRPLPAPAVSCACGCGCAIDVPVPVCGFCVVGRHDPRVDVAP